MGASDSSAKKQHTYARHKPEETVLYKLIQNNWLSFKDQVLHENGHPLSDFVTKEFDEYIKCGILAHGFLRVKCESCQSENLVAFSCKRRGFCPSCGGRRMSETAAHLVDSVLPLKNMRQWVLSFPYPIRLCLAVRPKIMARALAISNSVISKYYQQKVGLKKSNSKTGAVTLIQRFGGSCNVNPHFHKIFVDGCFELGSNGEPIDFHTADPPTRAELNIILEKIIKRFTKHLEKQKIIVKDDEENFQLEISEEDTFSKLQASSIVYRFATGPSKGKKAIVIKSLPNGDHNSKTGLVANNSEFSLHAGVVTKANERDKLEQICRYIARPAIAAERLSIDKNGDVIYKFKKPWEDGTISIKFTPMELMERLAALVPRPRIHLTRYHGVLGPHYKYRKDIVPKKKPDLTLVQTSDEAPAGIEESMIAKSDKAPASKKIAWAKLLKRVFNIDVEVCSKCAGKTRIIAAVENPEVIKKILEHLNLPFPGPIFALARGPPQPNEWSDQDQGDFFAQPFFDD